MEDKKETIYRFQGSAFLKEIEPEKAFFLHVKTLQKDTPSVDDWKRVSVGDVHVSGGPEKYYIHAEIFRQDTGVSLQRKYEISEDDYRYFQIYKGNKRRLDLLTKAAEGHLAIRKIVASKHIDLRVTPEFYEELSEGAKQCKMSLSDYCREHLKGKKPRAKLTDEELSMMMKMIRIHDDILNFRNALGGYLKGRLPQERVTMLIEGESLTWWRQYIKKSLICLDKFIQK